MKNDFLLENNLKAAIDERLDGMDWHGEKKVWRYMRNRSAARSVRLRTVIAACLIIALIGTTALAARALLLSSRANATVQARAALKQKYGLTDESIGLFMEFIEEQDNGWTAHYTLPVYDRLAGEYTVRRENGTVSTSWSLDGKAFPADGSLDASVWGEPQLERLGSILRDHKKAQAAFEDGVDNATFEERAAIDAPLLELPFYYDVIHILPDEEDLQPAEAETLARSLLENEFELNADTLDGCAVRYSFCLSPENWRIYRYDFTADDGAQYRVWFTSPDGGIVRIESNVTMLSASPDYNYDPGDVYTSEYENMTIEERYAYAEAKRQAGRDPKVWRDALPEEGELTQEEALILAKDALSEQFGVTGKALDAMDLSLYCEMDYDREGDPVKVWFFWFQKGPENYQITLHAMDGVIESIDYFDDSMGLG